MVRDAPRYGARRVKPPAHRPSAPPLSAGYPRPGGPSTPSGGSARQGRAARSTSWYAFVGCVCGVWSLAGRGGSSHLRLVSVSVVLLAVASWGVVRPGERRLRACRWSRGRRPSGSDSEATDRRAGPRVALG